jgi:hypothetical protein
MAAQPLGSPLQRRWSPTAAAYAIMQGDQPVPPLCPGCGQPLELVRTIPRPGASPEIFGFYCAPCKTIEVWGHYIAPPRPR